MPGSSSRFGCREANPRTDSLQTRTRASERGPFPRAADLATPIHLGVSEDPGLSSAHRQLAAGRAAPGLGIPTDGTECRARTQSDQTDRTRLDRSPATSGPGVGASGRRRVISSCHDPPTPSSPLEEASGIVGASRQRKVLADEPVQVSRRRGHHCRRRKSSSTIPHRPTQGGPQRAAVSNPSHCH